MIRMILMTGHRVIDLCNDLPEPDVESLSDLDGGVTIDDVKHCLKEMSKKTAPGCNSLTTKCYSIFFDTIGESLFLMIKMFFEEGMKLASFGRGRIALILKEGSPPSSPKSWRPINLLNTDYKLVATIVHSRLRPVLPIIISPCQACAVPGRSIFANLTLIRDVFEYAQLKRIGGAFISLDQEKAFDRVQHRYLFQILELLKLAPDFIRSIQLLYSNLSSDIMINGSITPNFNIYKAVHQGCPLGPVLFIISLEPLIRKVIASKQIRGFPMTGQEEVRVSAYADDISLFLRDEISLYYFRIIFEEYTALSGALINEQKSKCLLFGPFPSQALGAITIVQTVKILAVFFNGDGVAYPTWQLAIQKASTALELLQYAEMSLQSKALAVKTKVCAYAHYASRVEILPNKIAAQLNKLISSFLSFLWGNAPPLIKRHLLQLPPKAGGLSLPHITNSGKILPLKTVVSLSKFPDYVRRCLLTYMSSTYYEFLTGKHSTGPLSEKPACFYRTAALTLKMIIAECPDAHVTESSVSSSIDEITTKLSIEEKLKTSRKHWKHWTQYPLPKEVQDFHWKRRWKVLPTRDRLHKMGIVPNKCCPNCKSDETAQHALFE